MTRRTVLAFAMMGLAASASVAQAQVNQPQPPSTPSTPQPPQAPAPLLPAPNSTVPEQMLPNSPGGYQGQSAGSNGQDKTLSQKLGETGGVLKPPATIAPKMTVVPPAPNTDSGAVIAPSELPQAPQKGQNPTPQAD